MTFGKFLSSKESRKSFHLSSSFKFLLFLFSFFFIHLHANVRMGIISDANYCGERELAWRVKIAGESLGWDVFLDEYRGAYLSKIKNLDWVICLIPENTYSNRYCNNYMAILHPLNNLDSDGKLASFYHKYDGYLMTLKPSDSFLKGFEEKKRKLFSVPFYPTTQRVPYKRVSLNHLMTMIPVWGNRLTDAKYKNLYRLLSNSGFAKFYGIHDNKDIIQDGYMGRIPFDGVSTINILQKHGIVLILHSEMHLTEAIPSSRIFEAAAASAVVISDENPFIREHFGDSVFYIDTSLPSRSIFHQIQAHMNYIYLHPEETLEMARKAHEIFEEKFLMSDQLLQLEAMHRKIKSNKSS